MLRLTSRARRSGSPVEQDSDAVLRALRLRHEVSASDVDRLARNLWSSWRGVAVRGFNATSWTTKEEWRQVARAALRELGYTFVQE